MTAHSVVRSNVRKELRALAPAWIAAAIASVAVPLIHDRRFTPLLIMGYWVGAAALGAQSIGQEYTHRMLGVILAQPVHRRRLLAIKLGVLAVLLLALTAFTWAVMPPNIFRNFIWQQTATLIIAALCALFLAPPLTMATRSPLAGIIFSLVIPMSLLIGGELLAFILYGSNAGTEIDRLKLAVFWPGMIAICAAGAFLTWRMFGRLEAIEGRGREIHLPRWLRSADAAGEPREQALRRSRHPMWLLVKKEVRLQQMIFVIVALYFLLWTTEALVRRLVPDFPLPPAFPLSMLYFNLLPIVIGSLASAEERQFGTLESQLLLPLPMWQHWAVKAGTALGLAVVLGIGVPVAIRFITGTANIFTAPLLREMTLGIVLITSFALYLSSLSASGVRALVFALAFVIGGLTVFQLATAWASVALMRLVPGPQYIAPGRGSGLFAAWDFLSLVMAIGLTTLLLRFGYVNHRSAERSTVRTAWQLSWVAAFGAWMIILRVFAYTYYRLTPAS